MENESFPATVLVYAAAVVAAVFSNRLTRLLRQCNRDYPVTRK
ncbi:hypothetical protein [Gryllotalpicola sp.]|nr:hypothetical protein [Gryllotalpicola sp.]